MKKKILLLTGLLLVMSSVSYSAAKNSLEDSLNAIEGKFNDLLEKEAQRKREMETQKAQLEAEVAELKSQEEGKDKVKEKLNKDSEVRWYRDKYKRKGTENSRAGTASCNNGELIDRKEKIGKEGRYEKNNVGRTSACTGQYSNGSRQCSKCFKESKGRLL